LGGYEALSMSKLRLTIGVTPGTPPANKLDLYPKNDNRLYYKNALGVEYGPLDTGGGGGGAVGFGNAVYLCPPPRGNDGTGTRGDATKPFATLKAAIAACQSGDILYIAPGQFTIAVVADLPVWAPGLTRLFVKGSGLDITGSSGTVIKNTIGDASHVFAPPNTVLSLGISDLFASTTGTGRALYCDGTGAGGNYLGGNLNGGLYLSNCAFLSSGGTSATMKYVGIGRVTNVFFEIGGSAVTEMVTSNFIEIRGTTFGKLFFNRQGTDPDRPTAFLAESDFYDCAWHNDVELSGQSQIQFFGCDMRAIRGLNLSAIVGAAPRIRVYDGFVDLFDFQAPTRELPDTSESSREFSVRGTWVNSSAKFKVGGATNRWDVDFRGSTVENIAFSNIIADQGIDLDLHGASYLLSGAQFVTPSSGRIRVHRIDSQFLTDASQNQVVGIVAGASVNFTTASDYVYAVPGGLAAGFFAADPVDTAHNRVLYSIADGTTKVQVSSIWL
jgi:hypothetical protein